MPRILGREPSLIIATIGSALSVLVGFHFDWLTGEQAALIVAALNAVLGVVNALAVRPIAPAAFTYLVAAAGALLAGYGLHLSQEMVGAIDGLVLSVLMLLTRGQVTPTVSPRPIE